MNELLENLTRQLCVKQKKSLNWYIMINLKIWVVIIALWVL